MLEHPKFIIAGVVILTFVICGFVSTYRLGRK